MNNKIAVNMKEILISHNLTSVWYGDILLIEECAKKSMINTKHPTKTIQRILNALDNSTLFEKSYITADFSGRKRRYRCFTLKPSYSNCSNCSNCVNISNNGCDC